MLIAGGSFKSVGVSEFSMRVYEVKDEAPPGKQFLLVDSDFPVGSLPTADLTYVCDLPNDCLCLNKPDLRANIYGKINEREVYGMYVAPALVRKCLTKLVQEMEEKEKAGERAASMARERIKSLEAALAIIDIPL